MLYVVDCEDLMRRKLCCRGVGGKEGPLSFKAIICSLEHAIAPLWVINHRQRVVQLERLFNSAIQRKKNQRTTVWQRLIFCQKFEDQDHQPPRLDSIDCHGI
jgi:hypothetical protein